MNQPIPTPPEPQAGATTDEHPATYGFKGPRPGAANLVHEYPLPFEVKGDNPPMVVAANGEAILSLMWPVHVQTPEGERAAVDYVAAIAKDVADSLNRKDIPALIATPDLAAIQARCDAATPGPWHCIPGDSFCAYPCVLAGDKQFIFEDHEGHDPNQCPRNCKEGGYPPPDANDAIFIAHARTDIPSLLDALATSRAETAKEKERADFAWKNTHEIDKARITAESKLAALTATLARREAEVEHWKNEMNQLPALVKARTERDTALARVRELEAVLGESKHAMARAEAVIQSTADRETTKEEQDASGVTGTLRMLDEAWTKADALIPAAAARAAATGEEGAGI